MIRCPEECGKQWRPEKKQKKEENKKKKPKKDRTIEVKKVVKE